MEDIFSEKISRCLFRADADTLCELRLRSGGRAVALTRTGRYYLGQNGLSVRRCDGVVCDPEDLLEVLKRVTNRSVYACNEQLRQGFVTYRGIRIGVCGEAVRERDRIVTIKNPTSLVVRFPREISCADPVLSYLVREGKPLSTLVFAPPGCGKTTLLRDLAKKLSYADRPSHIVMVDERGEFGAYSLGDCDVLKGMPKAEGLHFAVRNLNPDAVICDELKSEADAEAVFEAASCGVAVLASVHAATAEELRRKPALAPCLAAGVFERMVRLSARRGLGTVEELLDGGFCRLAGMATG